MKEQDKIEHIFQEGFKDFEIQPDPSVWSGIESSISGSSSSAAASSITSSTSVAAKIAIGLAIVSGLAVSSYFIFDKEPAPEKPAKIQNEASPNPENSDSEKVLPLLIDSSSHMEKPMEFKMEEKNEAKENTPKKAVKRKISQVEQHSSAKKDSSSFPSVDKKEFSTAKDSASTEEAAKSSEKKAEQKNLPIASSEGQVDEKAKSNQSEQMTSSSTPNRAAAPEVEESKEIPTVIPNIFTPNGDGFNDVFRIETEAENMQATILDRQGKVVFEWTGLYGFWDGNLPNGKPAEVGQYFYRIILMQGDSTIPKTGTVRLER